MDAPEAIVEEEPYNFEALAKAVEGSTYIYMLDCGVFSVGKGDEQFYVDLQGNILDSQPEEEVDPNALMARYNDGLFGYVDADKNLVIPYQYHFACDFSDGMGLVINRLPSGWLCQHEGRIGHTLSVRNPIREQR